MKNRRRKIRRRRKNKLQQLKLYIGVSFIALIVILSATYLFLNNYVSKHPQNKVAENIHVGPVDASGMTKQQLKNALTKHLETKKATEVTFLIETKKETETLETLGISYKNLDKTVNTAFA